MKKAKKTKKAKAKKAKTLKKSKPVKPVKKKTKKSKPAAKPTSKPSAKVKPAAPTAKVAPPPVGPELLAREKGVHFMLVRDDEVPVGSHANPDDNNLQKVLKHVMKKFGKAPAMTDVVVFGGQPYHHAGGKLRKHPQVHTDFPETILVLHRGMGHKAVWWSEESFNLTSFVPVNKHAPYPFSEPPVNHQEGVLWVSRSTVAVPEADHTHYKISFEMAGRTIDPHMDTEP